MNKTYLTKKQVFEKIINYLLKEKKEKQEIFNNLDYYYNASIFNFSINIKRLINLLNYEGYTIKQESKNNINNFIQFLFYKYKFPKDLSIAYTIKFYIE
ncbi:MAG: hypothetical protein SOT71_08210 [Romboutsia timonensis]|uniref:hypothetical protein n=1 Tax=Romboutsia timonensis TaxID=1776391 RepID=UPI002A74EEF9|nr:hypothetical protein [Romboutsia timonensis]MDY2882622.1 hypothetical protein [Romboutsia timonensis]